jgi:hypothetical protein
MVVVVVVVVVQRIYKMWIEGTQHKGYTHSKKRPKVGRLCGCRTA